MPQAYPLGFEVQLYSGGQGRQITICPIILWMEELKPSDPVLFEFFFLRQAFPPVDA